MRIDPRLAVLMLLLTACDRPREMTAEGANVPSAASATESSTAATVPSFVSLVSDPTAAAIRFRITAPKDRPLFLENCNGAISWGLEHERSGAWVPAWGAEINGCHSAPIEIAAGTMREFHEARAIRPGTSLPPAPYRLAVYGLYFTHEAPDHSGSIEVPHALRLSAPFTPKATLAAE